MCVAKQINLFLKFAFRINLNLSTAALCSLSKEIFSSLSRKYIVFSLCRIDLTAIYILDS